ncbi:hypothetical protein COP2_005727 [Malus domestica]
MIKHAPITESKAVTAVWNSRLELPDLPRDLCIGIWMMWSTAIDDDDLDGPGKSCWNGELAEMMMTLEQDMQLENLQNRRSSETQSLYQPHISHSSTSKIQITPWVLLIV